MTEEELERIEEAYETRIGPDAITVRVLLEEIRRLQQEVLSCSEQS
jgi:DNA anti-recombination protein RmuC